MWVVDKARLVCGPRVSSQLDYWMSRGQCEGVEMNSSIAAWRRIKLLEKDPRGD